VADDHLDHLYVRPGYYRQGIGDRLLAQAKAMSEEREPDILYEWVASHAGPR